MAPKVYVFKVALREAKQIWRRIAIRSDQTLDDLHAAIYAAFDREEEHLYSFYVAPFGRKGRARLRDAEEYTHPFALEDALFPDSRLRSAAETRIGDLTLRVRQRLHYLFDFGDSWWHELTVEQTDGPVEKGEYPRILEKQGESPPQYPEPDG